jgi:hypothetical protein
MKPIKSVEEFWTSKQDVKKIDIFQSREDLSGFSLASVMPKQPREFE